jgi:TPR repeat protein
LGAATLATAALAAFAPAASRASPSWMRATDLQSATDASSSPHHLQLIPAQAQGHPALNVSRIILAEPAVETPLPIQVGPLETIARNSFIRIRGLPPAAALTEGHSIAPGAWAIPIMALPSLKITLPVGHSGKSDVTVALVTVDGTVVAEAQTSLIVAAASLIAPGDAEPKSKSVASLGPASSPPPASRSGEPLSTKIPSAPELTEEQKRAAAMLTKGEELLAQGNIASARLFFRRAAEAGLGRAALALAATYDPDELDRLGVRGVQPDPAAARTWYERARQLGAVEAEERLKRLGAR